MTVSSTDDRTVYIVEDTLELTYQYDFQIYSEDDLEIYFDDQQWNDPVTITGVGNPSGGFVTFDYIPPTLEDTQLTLVRQMEFTQPIDYTAYDDFPAVTHETGLDRLTYMVIQLWKGAFRAISFPITDDSNINTELPPASERANKYLFFNADGSVAVSDGTVIAPGASAAGTTFDPSAGGMFEPTDINVQLALDALNAKALDSRGDTMTGALVLVGDPSVDDEAARKGYVDNSVANKIEADSYATNTVGGTLKARLSGTDLYLTNDGTNA